MKALLKKIEPIIIAGLGLIFVLLALLVKREKTSSLFVFLQPFEFVASGITKSNSFFGYCIFILFGILPLIYPIARIIKTRRLLVRDIAWVALSVLLFFVLYYFINPHKIGLALEIDVLSQAFKEYIQIPLLGMAVTAYTVFLTAIFIEILLKFKNKQGRVYDYINIIMSVFIIGVLFKALFLDMIDLKSLLNGIPESNEIATVNRPINIFAVLFGYAARLTPYAVAIVLLFMAKNFIISIKQDSFSGANINKLNKIIKTIVILIFVSLLAVVFENLLYFIFSKHLFNTYYKVSLPVAVVLLACIALIFLQILKKAILIDQENKLVI